MKNSKRMIAIILTAALALSLMLTACSKSGDNPTGDNSTPGTSTPGTTSGGDKTPGTSKIETAITPELANLYAESFVLEKLKSEELALINERAEKLGSICEVNISDVISGAIEKYGKYFNEYIPEYALRGAVLHLSGLLQDKNEITGITDSAFAKVNAFLATQGAEPFVKTDPEQNVASLAIAAILLYQEHTPNEYGVDDFVFDLAAAFGKATSEKDENQKIYISVLYATYCNLGV